MLWTGLVFLAVVLHLPSSRSLECFECVEVAHVADCKSVVQCPAGSSCQATFKSNKYSLGCTVEALCPTTNTSSVNGGSGTIVGRTVTRAVQDDCSQCCNYNSCNRQLCQSSDPSCHDSGTLDCVSTAALINICADTVHANKVCKQFCGLCSLVNGNWSPWTSWSQCSVTCSNGTEVRTRSCTDPAPASGGSDCTGLRQQTRTCAKELCPVNGGFSDWTSWSNCSVSCGLGLRRRRRSCSKPPPSNSGANCIGDTQEDEICVMGGCIDGGWSDWSIWGTCTTSCDGGLQSRSRACTNPSPSLLGKPCTGDPNQVQQCSLTACASGGWSDWGSWSTCTTSCDGGMQSRTRTCTNPSPSLLGKHCTGDSNQVQQCSLAACANGGWTGWGSWGTCTTSCDGGFQSRSRECTNPSPSLLGKPCAGDSNQVQQCSLAACANGGWTDWGSWGRCTTSCDGGFQSRSRECTNPSPSILGKSCTGDSYQVQQCSLTACTNGGWSDWGSWGTCTTSCDGGFQSRPRTCTNPSPSLLGKSCTGDSNQVQQCSLTACANGGWSDWGSWSACTTSCDGGFQSRTRTCTNPSPSLLGKLCTGDSNQVQQCSLTACVNHRIGFTVFGPADTGENDRIKFTNVTTNDGGGYNNSTGFFTCPVSGMYYFSFNLMKPSSSAVSFAQCYICRDTYVYTIAYAFAKQPDTEASTSVYVHLPVGERIRPRCTPANTMGFRSSFSGFLIKAD